MARLKAQAQWLQEETENQRSRKLVVEAEAQKEQSAKEAKMRKVKRGAGLHWFKDTQAQEIMQDDEAFPSWLHGMTIWRSKGSCRHYMIQMQPNACYVILGEDGAHTSLTKLVLYHQTVSIQPFMEILAVPCGQVSSTLYRNIVMLSTLRMLNPSDTVQVAQPYSLPVLLGLA
ncbi:SH2 domain-containing protein 7 isoform X3 [Phalacrocorax carbo]|uniref:SH2 domain-containing protein 7 isoform X3 n=1 Tax=Phalacrocorax carbo TaxID=9209 RepID=UPI00311A3951